MNEEPEAANPVPRLSHDAAARLLDALEEPDEAPATTLAHAGNLPPGYIVDRRLGGGGGGEVYRAFRAGSDRPIALKILSVTDRTLHERDGGRSPLAQRARREFELHESLHIPVVPRPVEYGVVPSSGRLYMATEFVEGRTLEQRAGDERPWRETALLMARVCEAVQLLHERGVIHRDLKPSNIIIDTHGQPILIDLGIAAIIDPPDGTGAQPAFPTLTETGTPIGTPAYMAPEQARGERHRLSTRWDVYALGATAYKLFTGNTPHDTNTTIHEAIRRVAFDEPRDPRALAPALPKPLAAVLSKACQREQAKRYGSAAEFGADLRRWANGEPVTAVPPGAWQKAVKWAGRHPIAATAGACAAVIGVSIGGTWLSILWLRYQPADMVILGDQSRAILTSRTGEVLAEWDSGQSKGIILAEYLMSTHATGRPRALLGAGMQTNPELESSIFSIDPFTHRSERVLNTGNVGLALPDEITEREGEFFAVKAALIADVFSDTPDPEMVSIWYHWPQSPTAILVHDLEFNRLATYWHDGQFDHIHWLPGPRVLLAAGVNAEQSWSDLGYAGLNVQWPAVVAALRPRRGETRLIVGAGTQPDGETLLWYRAFWPPSAEEYLYPPILRSLMTMANASTHARLSRDLRDRTPGGGISWNIDSTGRLTNPLESDGFRAALREGAMPHAGGELRLVEWTNISP